MLSSKTRIKRNVPPQRRGQVRRKRDRPRRGPDRSQPYLAWIRTLDCSVCCRPSGGAIPIEAAHTNVLGCRGMRQKTSDFSVIPLCQLHHRWSNDSYHALGEKRFSERHRVDITELVASLNLAYRRRIGRFSKTETLKPAQKAIMSCCV